MNEMSEQVDDWLHGTEGGGWQVGRAPRRRRARAGCRRPPCCASSVGAFSLSSPRKPTAFRRRAPPCPCRYQNLPAASAAAAPAPAWAQPGQEGRHLKHLEGKERKACGGRLRGENTCGRWEKCGLEAGTGWRAGTPRLRVTAAPGVGAPLGLQPRPPGPARCPRALTAGAAPWGTPAPRRAAAPTWRRSPQKCRRSPGERKGNMTENGGGEAPVRGEARWGRPVRCPSAACDAARTRRLAARRQRRRPCPCQRCADPTCSCESLSSSNAGQRASTSGHSGGGSRHPRSSMSLGRSAAAPSRPSKRGCSARNCGAAGRGGVGWSGSGVTGKEARRRPCSLQLPAPPVVPSPPARGLT